MTLKNDLIAQAKSLGLATDKLTIVQLKAVIKQALATPQTPADNPTKDEAPLGFTKAGKRSKKSIEAVEAEAKRQARKQLVTQPEVKPLRRLKSPPSKLERRSKKYRQVVQKLEAKKIYQLQEGLEAILQTTTTNFDSSVEMVVALGVNTKLADQNIRDFVILPNGSGKTLRIAVFAEEKEAQQALAAGAVIAGYEIFLQQLDKGLLNFDILITQPRLMADLSKYAKLLGPKGLMPNPKSGTITKDIGRAIADTKTGKIEYRVNEHGLIHLAIGKVSFGVQKLKGNLEAVLTSIKNNKPSSYKGIYIKQIHLSTTMGPSLQMATTPHKN